MALIVFSMLTLVLSVNYVILLSGWGLVGLSSYLLIGVHHERPSAVAAAKKAFVMNAVGDATRALAFFLLLSQTGTLGYGESFAALDGLSGTVVALVALGILGGAVAKSAQIPLHTWLPDAMEGPTPVSALIHAATMVTAGVFVIVRTHPVFEAAPGVHELAAAIGVVTLLVAGLIALVQTDIKRVIAYSTMSQIGYMFLAVGIGAYASGMFHLLTHAFFKALLFLGAGIVIHALAGQQDLRAMGGLRKLMPLTFGAMLIGGLALAGVPPFSGFWSKDAILGAALATGGAWGYTLWAVGLAGAFVTGLYTFRMIFLAFWGEPSPYVLEHQHGHEGREGPVSMLVPVGILAVLATVGGLLEVPGAWHYLADFLHSVAEPLVEPTAAQDYLTSAIAGLLGLAGIGVAWLLYGARTRAVPRWRTVQDVLEHKLYFDELYDAVFYRPATALARGLDRLVERPAIGGSIAGVSAATRGAAGRVGRLQTGYLRVYALAIGAGAALLALVFVSVR